MNNKTIVLIDIPFNTNKHPFWPEFENATEYKSSKKRSQTKEWIDYRIDIFIKYTANSLINQTNQDFKCVLRYSKETEYLILDALSRHPKLPENIVFSSDADKYIEEVIQDYQYIYHIRLDSDNMYSKDYIEQLHKIEYYEGLECILCVSGYMYEIEHNRMMSMLHPSPSFYALVYTVDDFLLGFYHRVVADHWGAASLVHETISTPSFMALVHGKNLSNDFDLMMEYPYITTVLLDDSTKESVLKHFDML